MKLFLATLLAAALLAEIAHSLKCNSLCMSDGGPCEDTCKKSEEFCLSSFRVRRRSVNFSMRCAATCVPSSSDGLFVVCCQTDLCNISWPPEVHAYLAAEMAKEPREKPVAMS
ncbi:candoxin-like [Ambystoma mexicanum]|uniref:candoxin-like n=1 Tax=Ambystoma mexicanum TaxID=8296 RepID=UPI0037E91E03